MAGKEDKSVKCKQESGEICPNCKIKVVDSENTVIRKMENVDKEIVGVKNEMDQQVKEVRAKLEELGEEKIRDIDEMKRGIVNMKNKFLNEIKEEAISEVKVEVARISGNKALAEAQKKQEELGDLSEGRKVIVELTVHRYRID